MKGEVSPAMTLAEAIAAVEATFESPHMRVDRKRPMEDETAYLLVVLDTTAGRRGDGGTIANGPRLVDKRSGAVVRLTIPAALTMAQRMVPAR